MHFQLMNGPSLLGADGLPYVIDRFTYEGQVPPQVLEAADDYLSGTFLPSTPLAGQARTAPNRRVHFAPARGGARLDHLRR